MPTILGIINFFNISVLVYGLRSDFLGEPFEGSMYLMSLAESIIEVKNICFCGKKATMNVRIDDCGKKIISGSKIKIGGDDIYSSVCIYHYFNFNL